MRAPLFRTIYLLYSTLKWITNRLNTLRKDDKLEIFLIYYICGLGWVYNTFLYSQNDVYLGLSVCVFTFCRRSGGLHNGRVPAVDWHQWRHLPSPVQPLRSVVDGQLGLPVGWVPRSTVLRGMNLLVEFIKDNQNCYLKLDVSTSIRGLHQKKLVLSSSGSWHNGKTPCQESGRIYSCHWIFC